MTHPPAVDLPPLPKLDANIDSTHWAEVKGPTASCHNAFVCGYGVEGDAHLYLESTLTAYVQLAINEALERAAKMNLTLDEWQRVAEILNEHCDRGPHGEGYQSDELSKLSAKFSAAVDAMKGKT